MDLHWLKLCLLIYFPGFTICNVNNAGIIFNYNDTYIYNVPYTVYINKSIEYIMEFGGDQATEKPDTPARVTVASNNANRTYPLFITARQQKGVFSWQLPQLVQTPGGVEQFTNTSRTLCPHNNLFLDPPDLCDVSELNTPIIHLTSASPDSIEVTILVTTVEDFYIEINSQNNLTISPSQPQYFFYPFKQDPNNLVDIPMQKIQKKDTCHQPLAETERAMLRNYVWERSEQAKQDTKRSEQYGWLSRPKSVILMIESDNDVCAIVSIQNYSCPVFDNERDILYDGYYLTMTRRGGITLTQDQFPLGFYIVFIVLTSDTACVEQTDNSTISNLNSWSDYALDSNDGRVKSFSFSVVSTISYKEYFIAAGAALAFFGSFYIAFFISVCVQRRRREMRTERSEEEGDTIRPDVVTVTPRHRRRVINTSEESTSTSQPIDNRSNYENNDGSSSSDTESDNSTVDVNDKDQLVTKLCLANLARSRPRVLSARSKMYLWNVLTVAVFYTLPVIQLVVTYQRMLNQSGNQDLCYFNFFCAHPLMVLSDFNHVYSNLGYVLLGFLFLVQVWRRQLQHKRSQNKDLGIPQHFGLLYAMGVALISEGLLSAAYHVCPNSMNFQFDTSFMYVTSILCMVKIYQSRHPDINARAHATFGVLALIIFLGLVGVLNANLYFWVAFTILHLVMCFIMTIQIYYLGRLRLDGGVIYRATRSLVTRPLAAVTPARCGRCVLLVIANLANWAIAAYGVTQHSKDFGSHLLLVLMSNLFLYTLFYIVMKLLHRESIRWYSWVYIGLTYAIWFSSSYFYLDQSTNWALTPAQSRQSNRVCSLLELYDSHDIWHFMSSTAMFFSFNMYLTIDDNLANKPRSEIMVF